MASLYIDFSYDDNVKRSINSAKRAINSRISDYNGIINSVNNTSSDTSNLWNANTYIKKKRDKLQTKWDKLDSFHTKIKDFNEYASDKDKAVADRIKEETNDFYKRENIKTGFLYTVGCVVSDGWKWVKGKAEQAWDWVCKTAKSTWEAIKQFYEDNKYIIDLIIDVVCVVAAAAALVAAIASGGALGIIFAVWGAADAVASLVYDGAALKAHNDGDEELAEELSNGGLKNVCEYYGGDVGVAIYHGMEIASAVYDITEFGKKAYGSINKVNTKFKTADRVSSYASVDKIKGIKSRAVKQGIKEIVCEGIGVKYTKKTPFSSGSTKGVATYKNIEYGIKTVHKWVSSDDPVGKKTLKTFKITGKFVDVYENAVDGYNVIFNSSASPATA